MVWSALLEKRKGNYCPQYSLVDGCALWRGKPNGAQIMLVLVSTNSSLPALGRTGTTEFELQKSRRDVLFLEMNHE